jgi:hypothetical protein
LAHRIAIRGYGLAKPGNSLINIPRANIIKYGFFPVIRGLK